MIMIASRSKLASIFAAACLGLFVLAGCASTGAGAPDASAAPAAATPDVRAEVGANGLPTPAALLARYVDALGGEAALRRHQSATRKGKMSIAAMGMEGTATTLAAAPDKMVSNVETGMGAINQGYDGVVGWSDNPMTGPQVVDGDQLANLKVQADFYMPLNYPKHFPTLETVEEVDYAGQAAYKVRGVNTAGRESSHYFAKDSGLMIGLQGIQAGPQGEAEVKITFSDHKEFDGQKMPGKTTVEVAGMQIEQTVETVTFDDVDPEAFELPAAVKALVK